MQRSMTWRISWATFSAKFPLASCISAVVAAVVIYTALAIVLGLQVRGGGLAIAGLSCAVTLLVVGVCGLKRRSCAWIGFPFTPIIIIGPRVVFQSWALIVAWTLATLLIGFGFLSQ